MHGNNKVNQSTLTSREKACPYVIALLFFNSRNNKSKNAPEPIIQNVPNKELVFKIDEDNEISKFLCEIFQAFWILLEEFKFQ